MQPYFGFAKELLDKGKASEEEAYTENSLYDLVNGFSDDIPYYLELAKRCGGEVLDLGCGTGRMLLPLVEAGVVAMGLDSSQPMLLAAEAKLKAYGHQAQLCHSDIRSFCLHKTFALIIMPYYTMMYMHSDEARLQVLRCAAKHLEEGGRLAFDFDTSTNDVGESLPWLALQGIDPMSDEVIVQVVQLNGLNPRLRLLNQINYRYSSSCQITVQSSLEATTSAAHMLGLLEQAGFAVCEVYGDCQKTPYQDGDACFIVAEKPAIWP